MHVDLDASRHLARARFVDIQATPPPVPVVVWRVFAADEHNGDALVGFDGVGAHGGRGVVLGGVRVQRFEQRLDQVGVWGLKDVALCVGCLLRDVVEGKRGLRRGVVVARVAEGVEGGDDDLGRCVRIYPRYAKLYAECLFTYRVAGARELDCRELLFIVLLVRGAQGRDIATASN